MTYKYEIGDEVKWNGKVMTITGTIEEYILCDTILRYFILDKIHKVSIDLVEPINKGEQMTNNKK